jgi:hypothetical protein
MVEAIQWPARQSPDGGASNERRIGNSVGEKEITNMIPRPYLQGTKPGAALKAIAASLVAVVFMIVASGTLIAQGPLFRGGTSIGAADVAGLQSLGEAKWTAVGNEVVGNPSKPEGGWLFLKQPLENAAVYASVLCTASCKAGVLLRAHEVAGGGMQGIYVSFTDGDLASFAVTLDRDGREVERTKLAIDPGLAESLAGPGGSAIMGGIKLKITDIPKPTPPPPGVSAPELNEVHHYQHGQWNEMNIILYNDRLNVTVNGTYEYMQNFGGLTDPQSGSFGKIALYAGGSGEAHFKSLRETDLNAVEAPKEVVSPDFHMQRLNNLYYSWGAAVADVNHDGIPDVIAGPYYYPGPSFTEAHEIFTPQSYNPTVEYALHSMIDIAYDFTGDGWPDLLVLGGNAGFGSGTLYVNPKGEKRHWDHTVVLPHVGNEDTLLRDLFGDGKLEVIYAENSQLCYAQPDPQNPTGLWRSTPLTEPGPWGGNSMHGMGIGDINGDGRLDLVSPYGWWEQPAKGSMQKYWTYHAQAFGRSYGGAEMGVFDVNGDGLNDVVTGLDGHGFGLAWYEQKRDANGKIFFIEHMIMDNFLTRNAGDITFTELHGFAFADMDGDGVPDIITGKRAFSHLFTYLDPDPVGAADLYWYRTVRDPNAPGGARFEPQLIHNQSGIGSRFAVVDVNADGKPDIVTSAAYGTFVFVNQLKK